MVVAMSPVICRDRGHRMGAETILRGFAPIAAPDARVLILGSMPGAESLAQGDYYAHPRNAFWPILADVAGIPPGLDRPTRATLLAAHGLAIWDVCRQAQREGSLDAAIRAPHPNDFATFLSEHGGIRRICFNGRTAATLFARLVRPGLGDQLKGVELVDLPSTSPAHAAMPFSTKLQRWRDGLQLD